MKKILIIDDEWDILEFLSYNFRKRLFEVHTAPNGREGYHQVREIMPDLIITDLLMPEMDGIEMCTEIRKQQQYSHIPVIFLSAVNDDYKILHAFSCGGDQFVSKPIRFEYLLQLVDRMLAGTNKILS